MKKEMEEKIAKYPYIQREAILSELADLMLDGVQKACEKGWIPKNATAKDQVVTGIMYIVAHELGKAYGVNI